MAIKQQYIFLIIFAVVISLMIITSIFYNEVKFDKSHISVFVKMLASLSGIMIAYGIFLTADVFENNGKIAKIEQTYKVIDRSYLNVVDKMRKLYPHAPNFIASLWPTKGLFPKSLNKNDDPAAVLELTVMMLKSFEDHMTGHKFDQTGEDVWAATFLQWGSSDEFMGHWKDLYPSFKKKTNEYASLIFEYARKGGKIKNADELAQRAQEFSSDPRVKKLFSNVK